MLFECEFITSGFFFISSVLLLRCIGPATIIYISKYKDKDLARSDLATIECLLKKLDVHIRLRRLEEENTWITKYWHYTSNYKVLDLKVLL